MRTDRPRTAALAIVLIALSWLWMMGVHEFGHVLHGWISGGTVEKVVLHPLTISRTDVSPNPRPLFVAWGGPIWGCLIPVGGWLVLRRWRRAHLLAFFAGFCLIANGAYLGVGAISPVGDAEVLRRLGVPAWGLAAFGAVTVPAGLWFWNGLGKHFGIGPDAPPIASRTLAMLSVLLAATVILELLLSEPM